MSLYYLILWNQVDILQKHFKKDHVHMRLWTRFYGISSFFRVAKTIKYNKIWTLRQEKLWCHYIQHFVIQWKEIWYEKIPNITNSFLRSQLFHWLCVVLFMDYWYSGIVVWPLDSHAESPGPIPTVARYFCPSAWHFIHIAALDPGVKWGPGRMRKVLCLGWHCARL